MKSFLMKNKLIMLAGLPGSGKTYLSRLLLNSQKETELRLDSNLRQVIDDTIETVFISSDAIREELYGFESEQGNPSKVFEQMRIRTEDALKAGKNVIYDACNINSKKRISFLKNFQKFRCEKICIICAAPYEMCLQRNSLRTRKVPEEVMKRMYMNWNPPYYYEGWDSIYIFFADGTKGSFGIPEDYVEGLMDYKQDNPHHRESLGVHMKETWQYLMSQYDYERDDNFSIAALIHDCGKPFTKVFQNARGEKTEIAHYYQHQCTGAHDALFFEYGDKKTDDILEISTIISLHMMPFSWANEKTKDKYLLLWGQDIHEKVMRINEADRASSHQETEKD